MKQIKSSIQFLMFFSMASMFCFTMCNEDSTIENNLQPTSELVSHTDCKTSLGNIHSSDHSSSEDCIEYTYSNGTLLLTHVNAGFNCCPGELTADITIVDDVITIEEAEETAGCHCDCLYDIDYRIENLSAGTYTITVVEPYAEDAEMLEFTVDLISAPSGSFCVTRDFYPWGEF